MTTAEQRAYLNGYIAGLKAHAWWYLDVQYVGPGVITLAEAIWRATKEWAVNDLASQRQGKTDK